MKKNKFMRKADRIDECYINEREDFVAFAMEIFLCECKRQYSYQKNKNKM